MTDETDRERADLLESLRTHRAFLRLTVQGLTDEQARLRTTASELTLGGLVKHVARMEERWTAFVQHGPGSMAPTPTAGPTTPTASCCATTRPWPGSWRGTRTSPGHRRPRRVLPSLDAAHPLPEAPWFQPGATRSARRVFVHLVAETAQHAGHADILRETLDGQKTMG